jgi:acyl CoA:acetate/3-ketoacid CoA transferase beta subunit
MTGGRAFFFQKQKEDPNWMVPGKLIKVRGDAMDLVHGRERALTYETYFQKRVA